MPQERFQYSSISGYRFSATVVHMSCSPREVQGCSAGPRGDQEGPGLHFQTQISTLGGVAVLGCLILRADPVHGKDGTPPNTRFRVGGSQADMARPMKRARPRAMRSKMCRRPRPRPAQGLAAAAATNPAVEWFSFFLGWNWLVLNEQTPHLLSASLTPPLSFFAHPDDHNAAWTSFQRAHSAPPLGVAHRAFFGQGETSCFPVTSFSSSHCMNCSAHGWPRPSFFFGGGLGGANGRP